jgi:diaminohydroxyphosphoribosylaminopyrimidine deaminase / 5-amino-6-(5-phosphoribosylamino)uracil reductase
VQESDSDRSWRIVRAAADAAARAADANQPAAFAIDGDGALSRVPVGDSATLLVWQPDTGWQTALSVTDPSAPLIDLYLPVCSATIAQPITIGHLGQSLDGFIATHAGESRWVTGEQNMLHMHRLRALCDAVMVGAGTVAIDDPLLTTRLVPGRSPLRVVIDPERRLEAGHRVFTDTSAETLYVCARSLLRSDDARIGHAVVVGVDDAAGSGVDLGALMRLLRARGCARVFVEGGGVTVSDFLAANLLDRLHIAIAPLLIGDGRPAIRLPPRAALGDCHRPRYRVFRMGEDILFDCDLRSDEAPAGGEGDSDPPVTRVI